MSTLETLEAAAKDFAEKRDKLAQIVRAMQHDMDEAKRKHYPQLLEAMVLATKAHDELLVVVGSNKVLFRKPKTRVMHGIECGYRKKKGSVVIGNEAEVLRLIRKHLKDRAEVLIQTTEKPVKAALSQLSGDELKKIGVTLTDATDAPYVKPADSEVDKLLAGLIGVGLEGEDEKEAA